MYLRHVLMPVRCCVFVRSHFSFVVVRFGFKLAVWMREEDCEGSFWRRSQRRYHSVCFPFERGIEVSQGFRLNLFETPHLASFWVEGVCLAPLTGPWRLE